ncbi:MAG TPA: T9SS type A sorting domain-containing protein [Puia sp.]|jgi:hypothetical protein
MKKFYLLILTTVFLFTSLLSRAQGTYTSISPNSGPGAPYTLDDPRFWTGNVAPPNPCNLCTIVINSSVNMVPNDGSTTSLAGGGVSLNDIVISNSTLQVNGGVNLNVETYVEMVNTNVLIGSDATTAASVFINDQVVLSGTSTIQLANVNTFVNANNDFSHPINGPLKRYNGASGVAGVYYLDASDPKGYDFVLSLPGIGNSTNMNIDGASPTNLSMYTINCDGNGPPNSNTCLAGIINGPSLSFYDAVNKYLSFQQTTTLPVVLVQFLATRNADGSIKLSWATAEEINSASFEVERSADQGTWEKIGTVAAKGYSSTTANYSYIDQSPFPGNNYYRLKMIDLDGRFKYSKVVAVTSDKDNRPLVIYSNPFNDQIRMKVNVDRAQNLILTVSDIIGKTYLKQSYNAQAGGNLINLVPAGAAGGMYILHIQGNSYEQTVKLVRQ